MQELRRNNQNQNSNRLDNFKRAERALPIRLAKRVQLQNKKAMAESVATFALIIIAIVAVGFAGHGIFKLLTLGDIQSSPTYTCLDLTSGFSNPIQLTKTCINPKGGIEATVKRNNEDLQINSISFTLQDESWTCKEGCDNCDILEPGTSKTYYLTPDENPLGKTLKFYVRSCEINKRKVVNC